MARAKFVDLLDNPYQLLFDRLPGRVRRMFEFVDQVFGRSPNGDFAEKGTETLVALMFDLDS